MLGVNKVILIGNLGQNPDTRYVNAQLMYSRLSVATTEQFLNQQGEPYNETEWHTIVLWRQLSKFAEQYLRKGDTVYIEGRLKSRYIEIEGGTRKKITEIVANRIDLIAHHDLPKPTQTTTEQLDNDNTQGSGLPDIDIENLPHNIPADETLPF